MSFAELDALAEGQAHPGVDLVQRFIEHGEWGVVDVLEAWRTCAAALSAFHGISARRLLELELEAGRGLATEPTPEAQALMRAALVKDVA